MNKPLTIHEVSQLTGVSIRTLHYYDEIGLLIPARISEAGYRLYDDDNLLTLQDILLFRELEFPLKEIRTIIQSPHFDRKQALMDQLGLLKLKRERMDDLISLTERLIKKGDKTMSFKPFDKQKIEAYKAMAKEVWGQTEAYKEYEQKDAAQSDIEKRANAENMMDIFYEFGDMKTKDPADPEVQAQVKKLQDFITDHYYTCTDQILLGLSQLYTAGDEMTANIDAAGGKGTADFVAKAIRIYCRKG